MRRAGRREELEDVATRSAPKSARNNDRIAGSGNLDRLEESRERCCGRNRFGSERSLDMSHRGRFAAPAVLGQQFSR